MSHEEKKPVFSSFEDLARKDAIRENAGSANRTFFASEALKLTAELTRAFGDLSIGTNARHVSVTGPEETTDGGRKARQQILLVPARGGADPIMCGWFDTARHVAEVRSYNHLRHQQEARQGGALDFSREEYADLIDAVQSILRNHEDMPVTMVDAPRPGPTASHEAIRPTTNASFAGSTLVPVVTFLVGAMTGFGLCWILFVR